MQYAHSEIDRLLVELPERISHTTEQYIIARELYQRAKATREYKYNQIYLLLKSKNPESTQGDLRAEGIIGSHSERLEMIIAESKYRKIKEELKVLRDKLEAIRELAYNLRVEMKSGLMPDIKK